ncbi:MAG: hypothetical protein FWD57_15785 [Polyangiaceae bacterium]|nr:hypothetical protein [Polyangiaceae bacterium]
MFTQQHQRPQSLHHAARSLRCPVSIRAFVLAASLLAAPSTLAAGPDSVASASVVPAAWSANSPEIAARIRSTKTVLVKVVVALCSYEQINCGGTWAGHPGGLRTNIYWGAIFGARTFFERSGSPWSRVDVSSGTSPILEQVVFRRHIRGAVWGVDEDVEALVVLQAFHGSLIHRAVGALWETALSGGEVLFRDGGNERKMPVDVVGYAGHNRLMDGLRLPPVPASPHPIPSFVLACMSERHFGLPLRQAGSPTLLTTRSYMAPEGYVIDAVAGGIAENRSVEEIRSAAVDATAQWQRIPRASADNVFAPVSVHVGP